MKTKEKPKKLFFTTNLRIDPKLADKIKKAAEAEKRSMNKEIELSLSKVYK